MISLAKKEIAVSFYRIYYNYSETVRRLHAIDINLSESGVRKIVKRSIQTGSVGDRPRSGRLRTTMHKEDLYLRRRARRSRSKKVVELVKTLKDRSGTQISTYTVSRRLRDVEFRRRVPVSRPLSTVFQKEKRLDFSNRYRKSRLNFWAKFIFSNKKFFKQVVGAQTVGLQDGLLKSSYQSAFERSLKEACRYEDYRNIKILKNI